MLEREELNFTIDIKVLKEEYFCQIRNRESGEIQEFSKKNLVSFAQRICWGLFFCSDLESGRCRMEEKFTRERIRTFIKAECTEEYFYLMRYYCEPVSVGIFISWEDGKTDLTIPGAEASSTTEHEPSAPASMGGVFVW